MTIVNCALSAIQHTEEEGGRLKLLETFCENMLVVLNGLQLMDAHSMQIRYDHGRKLTLLIERIPVCALFGLAPKLVHRR